MREDAQNDREYTECDADDDKRDAREYRLKRVKPDELIRVVRRHHEEDNTRYKPGQIAESAGDVFTHSGRLNGWWCRRNIGRATCCACTSCASARSASSSRILRGSNVGDAIRTKRT